MQESMKKTAMGLAALGALALGGSTLADAASTSKTTKSKSAKAKARSQRAAGRHAGGPGGPNVTPLTGDTADKVKAAALAKVPGTLVTSWADADGTYDALVRKTDGTVVKVEISKEFSATDVTTGGPGGPGGPGGHGPDGRDGAAPQGSTAPGSAPQTSTSGYGA